MKAGFIKEKDLGGVMFWSLDSDDFTGDFCGQGKYPLIKSTLGVLKGEQLVGDVKAYTSTPDEKIKTEEATNKKSQNLDTHEEILKLCPNGDGFYTNVASGCIEYHVCVFTKTPSANVQYLTCPDGLVFDSQLNACNFKNQVKCTKQVIEKKVSDGKCKIDGIFVEKGSGCSKYFFCAFTNTAYSVVHEYSCELGTLFNKETQECEKDFKCKFFVFFVKSIK